MQEQSTPSPEEWRPWPGQSQYLVSSYGRFARIGSGKRLHTGYVYANLPKDGGFRRARTTDDFHNQAVHIAVCTAFHGPPPAGKPEVDHIDRNRGHNRADNLRWASRTENMANRSYENNGAKAGEANPAAKVTADQAREIYNRARYESLSALGVEFGVTLQAIWLIARGHNWREETGAPEPEAAKPRLTQDVVRAIREQFAAGRTQGILASEWNIRQTTVSMLVTGQTWKDAGGPITLRGRTGRPPQKR